MILGVCLMPEAANGPNGRLHLTAVGLARLALAASPSPVPRVKLSGASPAYTCLRFPTASAPPSDNRCRVPILAALKCSDGDPGEFGARTQTREKLIAKAIEVAFRARKRAYDGKKPLPK
jgi:hypothetical protein